MDIYWDSSRDLPRLFSERPEKEPAPVRDLLSEYFDADGFFSDTDLTRFVTFMSGLNGHKRVRVRETVLKRVDEMSLEKFKSRLVMYAKLVG